MSLIRNKNKYIHLFHSIFKENNILTLHVKIFKHMIRDVKKYDTSILYPSYGGDICLRHGSEIWKFLFMKMKHDIEYQDKWNCRLIHYACYRKNINLIHLLIDHEVNINCRDIRNNNPDYYGYNDSYINQLLSKVHY